VDNLIIIVFYICLGSDDMSTEGIASAVISYGDLAARSSAGRQTSVDVIAAAIATKTIDVVHENWSGQYERFLDVFA
jgi:hypothetical protein